MPVPNNPEPRPCFLILLGLVVSSRAINISVLCWTLGYVGDTDQVGYIRALNGLGDGRVTDGGGSGRVGAGGTCSDRNLTWRRRGSSSGTQASTGTNEHGTLPKLVHIKNPPLGSSTGVHWGPLDRLGKLVLGLIYFVITGQLVIRYVVSCRHPLDSPPRFAAARSHLLGLGRR